MVSRTSPEGRLEESYIVGQCYLFVVGAAGLFSRLAHGVFFDIFIVLAAVAVELNFLCFIDKYKDLESCIDAELLRELQKFSPGAVKEDYFDEATLS